MGTVIGSGIFITANFMWVSPLICQRATQHRLHKTKDKQRQVTNNDKPQNTNNNKQETKTNDKQGQTTNNNKCPLLCLCQVVSCRFLGSGSCHLGSLWAGRTLWGSLLGRWGGTLSTKLVPVHYIIYKGTRIWFLHWIDLDMEVIRGIPRAGQQAA